MISSFIDILAGIMILIGAIFSLGAVLGLLRFPDVYSRMHAASKAGTLGAGLMLLAIAIHANDISIVTRAFAAIIFLLLTAPISAHLLARASYYMGYRPWTKTHIDELHNKYNKKDGILFCNSAEKE
jgi:multicomponent Na+:H+ antiporter subunit G